MKPNRILAFLSQRLLLSFFFFNLEKITIFQGKTGQKREFTSAINTRGGAVKKMNNIHEHIINGY